MQDRIAFGLRVRSTLDLPGSQPGDRAAPPQLYIAPGDAMEPDDSAARLGPYTFAAGKLLFRAPAIADYCILDGGNTITMQACAGAEADEVSALLIATAVPAALWMRGDLVLHAAAAVLPGMTAALAFAGPSGSGKSRLLAELLARGSDVVTEDSLSVRRDRVAGLPGCLFRREAGVSLTEARSRVEIPLARQRTSARIGCLIVLDGEAGLERLHGSEALAAVLDNFHRPRVPRLLGLLPDLLPRVAELLRTTPVYRWHPSFDRSGVATLQRLAEECDLAEPLPLI